MAKEEEGRIVMGRKNFWTISYADDISLMATSISGMKGMIRRFARYLRRKGLELNVKQSKFTMFR